MREMLKRMTLANPMKIAGTMYFFISDSQVPQSNAFGTLKFDGFYIRWVRFGIAESFLLNATNLNRSNCRSIPPINDNAS